ncbi:unnamed protein product [Macrosiphum euphorbiae]|uniref:Uncharacterized protein n=1 Tax=Macrosiphum euphorbiae TaxID=13131 RepID=A0AAV0XIV2_9HEMI|nr:unnamed protein product [Macrosiphum euphorbiae]
MVRQATGPNEHPTSPTFLQVYKLLSISSILKPPKTGNCQILDSTTPKITLTDLKELSKSNLSERQQKIEKLKEKINNIIDEDDECDPLDAAVVDIIPDHNYCEIQKATAKECVIYYICGFMCRQIVLKRTKCLNCLSALKGSDTRPEAALTNLKSKGFLIHPNYTVFTLVSAIEEGFVQYCDVPEVFDKTVNFLLQHHQKLLKFPCVEHESEMLTSIVHFYITMRMKQYTRNLNRETKKLSSKKKKLSKLLIH